VAILICFFGKMGRSYESATLQSNSRVRKFFTAELAEKAPETLRKCSSSSSLRF